LRVSTPTGAAEAATPNQSDILEGILGQESRLQNALDQRWAYLEEKLRLLSGRAFFNNPAAPYQEKEEDIDDLRKRLDLGMNRILASKKEEVGALKLHWKALDPESVLARGFSLTRNGTGKLVSSVQDIRKGEELETKLKDGIIHSVVK